MVAKGSAYGLKWLLRENVAGGKREGIGSTKKIGDKKKGFGRCDDR